MLFPAKSEYDIRGRLARTYYRKITGWEIRQRLTCITRSLGMRAFVGAGPRVECRDASQVFSLFLRQHNEAGPSGAFP